MNPVLRRGYARVCRHPRELHFLHGTSVQPVYTPFRLNRSCFMPVRSFVYDTAMQKLKKIGPNGIFLLTIPVSTFWLGSWQVKRRKWKLNLIASLEERTRAEPVSFPENLEDLDDLEYRKVKILGSFDHSREVYIGPRSLVVSGGAKEKGGIFSTGKVGYLVVTPFKLADRDLTIMVNRGWVPKQSRNPSARLEGQLDGTFELTGIVRMTEKRAPLTPKNTKSSSDIFLRRDIPAMVEVLDCSPVFLDLVETFPGGPEGGQTRVMLRNEHLSYIFTWYTLSAATSFLWYQRFLKGRSLM